MKNSWVHSQFKFWSVHVLLLLSICTSPTKSPPPTHTACRRLSESNCLISTSLRERRKDSRNKNTNHFSLFRLGPESKAQAGDKIIPFQGSTWGDGTRASQWRHPHAAPPTQLPWPLTQEIPWQVFHRDFWIQILSQVRLHKQMQSKWLPGYFLWPFWLPCYC